jgi:hypothetical protein
MSTKQLCIIVGAILVGALIVVFGPRFLDGSMSLPSLPDVSGPIVRSVEETEQKERDEGQKCIDYRQRFLMYKIAVSKGNTDPEERAYLESLRIADGCTESDMYYRERD